MEHVEKACTSLWGLNLLAVAAFSAPQPAHGLGVLLVFTAVFFLFAAPLHAALAGGAWLSYRLERASGGLRAARHAVDRWLCAESALFWAAYWGMAWGLLPLDIRL